MSAPFFRSQFQLLVLIVVAGLALLIPPTSGHAQTASAYTMLYAWPNSGGTPTDTTEGPDGSYYGVTEFGGAFGAGAGVGPYSAVNS